MTSFDLVLLAPEHIDSFEPGLRERRIFDKNCVAMLRNYWSGKALAAVSGRQTLGIGGVSMVGATAYPWMLLSDEMRRRYPISLTRNAQILCALILERDGASQMKVSVDLDFTSAQRWIEKLGFSVLDSNNDIVRYVRHGR